MLKLSNFSDEEIVEITRKKDKEAYAEIIRRYEAKLMRYASYLINDSDKAADAVQNAFIKAYINLNGFKINKKFSSWIYRIVHNETMNVVKKYKKEVPLPEGFEQDSGVDIEAEFSKKEMKQMIKKCLLEMPILYREPLMLFYLEEKSYDEISDVLRVPIGTVGTRINRAKKIMKGICQKRKI